MNRWDEPPNSILPSHVAGEVDIRTVAIDDTVPVSPSARPPNPPIVVQTYGGKVRPDATTDLTGDICDYSVLLPTSVQSLPKVSPISSAETSDSRGKSVNDILTRLSRADTSTASHASSDSSRSAESRSGASTRLCDDILSAAVRAAWECKFERAAELVESASGVSQAHMWAAKAEIALLRSALTGRRSDFVVVFDACSKVLECSGDSLEDRTLVAEVTLWRGLLQSVCGQSFRSCWNIRSAFSQMKKLNKDPRVLAHPRLRSRIRACIGLFYLGVPLMPSNYLPFLRLLGFATDEKKMGYDMIKEEALDEFGERNIPCALVMSLYHLDVDTNLDVVRDMLVSNLKHASQCPLLHWVASICAWRLAEIDDAGFLLQEALDCCSELEEEPAYLQYELALLHFVETQYQAAVGKLTRIHSMADTVVFPYRAMLPILLAASLWALGRITEGDEYARESVKISRSPLEMNLSKVTDRVRAKRSAAGKALFAIEVCYLLRLLTRLPRRILQCYFEKISHLEKTISDKDQSYLLMLHCIMSFHLGDVRHAHDICSRLEVAASRTEDKYYKGHGMYWCCRVWNLLGDKQRAISCAQKSKKAGKRYPFDISTKVSAFLDEK